MASTGIEVWLNEDEWKNVITAARLHFDSDCFILAINSSHHLCIRPTVRNIFKSHNEMFGVIKIEEWKEGLVVWVGGEIRWKSWENNK